ncbi:MAG: beta-glucosidase BglX [Planctomycetota bacterium]
MKLTRLGTFLFTFSLCCLFVFASICPDLSGQTTAADTTAKASAATGPTATGPEATGPAVTEPSPEREDSTSQLPKLRLDRGALSAEEYADKLLSVMTLEEKLGQMQQIFPGGETLSEDNAKQVRQGRAGSIFFVGHPAQVREAQRVAVEESRLGIPLLVARDVIHGFRTIFPIPLGQAASWNPALVRKAAKVAANESRRVGIHWTFAPMVDIARDPRWGRIAESCGEDPYLASLMGAAMVEGFQSADSSGSLDGLVACPKHYAAYGLAEGGRDYNRVMVSRNELRNVYLPPFKGCVDAGALSLMTAFNTVNGVPATANQHLLRDILKGEWKFPGMVVTDWETNEELVDHGFAPNKKVAAKLALQAGVDMEMVSTCYNDNLAQLLDAGHASLELVDDAVRRILLVKLRMNLFEQPYADDSRPALLSDEHRQVAHELARQSVVMLKNDRLLPLDKSALKKVVVVGPYADTPQDQLGCWVMDAQAEDSVTPLTALREALGDSVEVQFVRCPNVRYGEAQAEIDEALAAAADADVVLLFVGEDEAWSGEAHSRVRLTLTGTQSELVAGLGALDVPVAMTVMAGRPLAIGDATGAVDAVLYAWQQGTMTGPALADLLLGVVSPSGKLPVTFPKSVGQVPLYYNHPITGRPAVKKYRPPPLEEVRDLPNGPRYASHYIDSDPFPLFLFGFGLTYSDFEYYDLKIGSPSVREGEELEVSVRVSNVGSRSAVETVQVYTRDLFGSVVRPVKELKAFRQVPLEPGESKVVSFKIPYESLGFYNEREEYLVESGRFKVAVGGSSDTSLSAKFSVD